MKCPKCQSDNPETATFCADCGTNLSLSRDIEVTETLETPKEELTTGSAFAGRYQIIEELGKGGMGRVYRALDKKLNEEVALKLIKPEIATDKKTLERFSNELKVARKIVHKNVGRMYHLSEDRGTHYITMEYVPGEDLKSFIRRSGQLAVGTSIRIAKQVCEGLSEAHKLGVVHRDLKPGNIMIDKEGNARIMDFGIARSLKGKGITGAGVMIGTPEYMSPEQVEGKEIDQRTDIYSLGIILYEMATGRTPFDGETAFIVAMKHKSEKPKSPRELNTQIGIDLNNLILKCMEKDKENRYQNIEELIAELTKIEHQIPSTERVVPKRKPITSREITVKFSLKKLYIPVLALIAVAVLISVSIFLIKRQPPTKPMLPQHKQLTFAGDAKYPAISPDGKFIAYVIERFEADRREDAKIIVQDIVSGQDIEVLRVYYCQYLRWLPDSSELSFSATTLDYDSGIFVISPLGGTPRRLSDQNIEGPIGYAWSPDGSQYAWVGENQIHIRSRSTGDSTPMNLNLNESVLRIFDVDWSPEGSFMLILTFEKERKYAIWTISVDGRKQSKVIEDSVQLLYPRWSPRGDAIYYLQQKDFAYQCWKIPVSLNAGEPSKAPLPILPGIHAGRSISVSKNGKMLLYTRESRFTNLWLASIEGTEKDRTVKTKQLTTGTFTDTYPSISPDGNFIAFSRGIGSVSNIYIMPLEGGSPRQITNFNSLNLLAKWSPDGKEVAFGSNEGGTPQVWKVNVQGGSPFQFVKTKLSAWFDLAWSPRPNIIYRSQSNSNFNVLNPITEEESLLLKEELDRVVSSPRYSPDGKKVAYEQSGGLWVVSLESASTALLKEGDYFPIKWSSDGKWIYVSEPAPAEIKILMISVENSFVRTLLSLPIVPGIGELRHYRFNMTPNGRHIVFEASRRFSDVWMVENFDPDVK